ncbi:MAG: hypothetical protein B7Z15_05975 [Rhizobiales bacterium 32-66-8]|nr:MAG: hypothetical protein B7Z15_05975 [Rhizobiales bacterium 32-66-8]
MLKQPLEGQFIEGLGVIETSTTDNVLRWDGTLVYVEHDIYHNGQLVHSKYRRKVTKEVARALLAAITAASPSN